MTEQFQHNYKEEINILDPMKKISKVAQAKTLK